MGSSQSAILNDLEVGESLINDTDNKLSAVYKIWNNVAPARFQNLHNVTVFSKNFDNEDNEETKKFYENGIKNLKTVRHPCIAKFYSAYFSPYDVCLIVERVRPLDYCLKIDELMFEAEEILSGLQNIFEAVKFMHEIAKLSHNNIAPVSVFVCPDQTWKLGCFEFSLSAEGSAHWCQSDFVKNVKEVQFVPPEDQTVMAVKAPWYARDIYGLGKLIEYLLPYLENNVPNDQLREIECCANLLCSVNALERPKINEINYDHVFRNCLSVLSDRLKNIPYLGKDEKDQFFNELLPRLRTLSPALVARRLSTLLLSRYVLVELSAINGFAREFLTPKFDDEEFGVLPIGLFKRYVIPEMRKIFRVHETCIRLNVLSLFDNYVEAFDKSDLQNLVLPELLLGMKDMHEDVVSSSMRCLARLVPLLGADIVTGLVHKKYFSDGKPREKLEEMPLSDVSVLKSVKSALQLEPSSDSLTKKENISDEHSEKEKRRIAMELRRKEMEAKRKSKALSLPVVKAEKASFAEEIFKDEESTLRENLSVEKCSSEGMDFVNTVDEDNFEKKSTNSADWSDWSDTDEKQTDFKLSSFQSPRDETSRISQTVPVEDLRNTSATNYESVLSKNFEDAEKSLGSEFDIFSVNFKSVGSDGEDFFADMTPVVRKPLTGRIENEKTKFDVLSNDMEPVADSGWNDED